MFSEEIFICVPPEAKTGHQLALGGILRLNPRSAQGGRLFAQGALLFGPAMIYDGRKFDKDKAPYLTGARCWRRVWLGGAGGKFCVGNPILICSKNTREDTLTYE
jgi:hypothetical protein